MNVLLSPRMEQAIGAAKDVRSGSFIFAGVPHIGKATAAKQFARELNCQGDEGGLCSNCKRLAAGAYPDFVTLSAEPGKSILITQVRALRAALGLKPYESGRRLVLIDEAHLLTDEAQNALLKLIEEPPADTIFILCTHRLMSLLPTVRSRCATVYFSRVEDSSIEQLLVGEYSVAPDVAKSLAKAARGIPGNAIRSIPSGDNASAVSEIAAIPDAGLLDRLVSVKRFIDGGTDPQVLIEALHNQTTVAVIDGQDQSSRLVALDKLSGQLEAGVNPRIALERFMVEL